MNWYLFWRYVHFAGILAFVAGHGVSVAITLRLPKERDLERLEVLLGLSRSTIVWSNLGLVVLVIGGAANWIRVSYSPQGWLWAAVGILVVLAVVGFALAAPAFRRVRSALASGKDEVIATALSSVHPWAILWIETLGVVVILWLMVYKPF